MKEGFELPAVQRHCDVQCYSISMQMRVQAVAVRNTNSSFLYWFPLAQGGGVAYEKQENYQRVYTKAPSILFGVSSVKKSNIIQQHSVSCNIPRTMFIPLVIPYSNHLSHSLGSSRPRPSPSPLLSLPNSTQAHNTGHHHR